MALTDTQLQRPTPIWRGSLKTCCCTGWFTLLVPTVVHTNCQPQCRPNWHQSHDTEKNDKNTTRILLCCRVANHCCCVLLVRTRWERRCCCLLHRLSRFLFFFWRLVPRIMHTNTVLAPPTLDYARLFLRLLFFCHHPNGIHHQSMRCTSRP